MTEFYYFCNVLGVSQSAEMNKRFEFLNIDLRIGPAFWPDWRPYTRDDKNLAAGLYSIDKSRATPVEGRVMTLDDALSIQAEAERELNRAMKSEDLSKARRLLEYI